MVKIVCHILGTAAASAVLLIATAGVCAADWRDYVDDEPSVPPVEETEAIADNPAWEKYAFDLPFADNSGRLSFNDLARKGEPFVLFWWRSDCSKCHLQMPYVEHLQNQIDELGLKLSVVSISLDNTASDCLKVVREKKISFPVLIDLKGRSTGLKYKKVAEGPPQAYLFGSRGVFKGTIDGYQSSFVKTVFRELEIELPTDELDTP